MHRGQPRHRPEGHLPPLPRSLRRAGAGAEGRQRPRAGCPDGAVDQRGAAAEGDRVRRPSASAKAPRSPPAGTGSRPATGAKGWFHEPTIFSDVSPAMRIAQEEIFGPVVSVIPCDGLDDAIQIANGVAYGLSGAIYTRDVNAAFTAMRDVESGLFYVNAPTIGAEVHLPFGGIKGTGNGHREAGSRRARRLLGMEVDLRRLQRPPAAGPDGYLVDTLNMSMPTLQPMSVDAAPGLARERLHCGDLPGGEGADRRRPGQRAVGRAVAARRAGQRDVLGQRDHRRGPSDHGHRVAVPARSPERVELRGAGRGDAREPGAAADGAARHGAGRLPERLRAAASGVTCTNGRSSSRRCASSGPARSSCSASTTRTRC